MSPPRTAYILLWFPEPTETFIFREVVNLWRAGFPLKVFTLYGPRKDRLSPEMLAVSPQIERLGMRYAREIHSEILYWIQRNRGMTLNLLRTVPVRKWNGLEKGGENLWSFAAGFRLARRFIEEGIEHIHAPWANGPATAAWIASKLTGIPFSFTARAWDIYPPDGALKEKIHDALFIRSETKANIRYLHEYSGEPLEKFRLTYNGVPLKAKGDAPVPMQEPYKFLAVGRFVGKKGYDYLLKACRILKKEGMNFRLSFVGSGPREKELKFLVWKYQLTDFVEFCGYVTHDRIADLFMSADIFIMPSIIHKSGDRDGIPTVLMEALMHRVPVIATDISGIGELVEDGVTGKLIREKNECEIVNAIRFLIENRNLALEMAEHGRHRVLELFNPEVNHKRVQDLFIEEAGPMRDSLAL